MRKDGASLIWLVITACASEAPPAPIETPTEGGVTTTDDTSLYVMPGQDKSAEINTAIAALGSAGGGAVRLLEGTYGITQPLVLQSNVTLRGEGNATVLLVEASVTGAADAAGNAVILIDGVMDGSKLQTVLAVAAPRDASQLTLQDSIGLATGDFLYLEGPNQTSNSLGSSDGPGVILKEPVQIASISGAVVTLTSPLSQYHAAGVTATALMPIADAAVEDLLIDARGASAAVGVLLRRAVRARVDGVSGAGLSRALVDVEGTRGFGIRDVGSRGATNSIVYCDSGLGGTIDGIRSDPFGLRHHPQGIPRGMLTFRNRCSDVAISSGVLEHGTIGVQVFGGRNLVFGDMVIRDMDADAAAQRWPLVGEGGGTEKLGAGLTGGATPLEYAEFSNGLRFGNVYIEDARHAIQGLRGASAYLHDMLNVHFDSLSVTNSGAASPGTMAGVIVSDTSGHITSLVVAGVDHGLRTENFLAGLQIDEFLYSGTDGLGGSHQFAMLFDHRATGPRILRTLLGNVWTLVRFGPSFADWGLTLENYAPEEVGGEYEYAMVAFNASGTSFAVGDVVEIQADSPPGTIHVDIPAGPSTRAAVVCSGAPYDYGIGWLMICPLPARRARIMCTTAAVNVGDQLIASGPNRRCVADNAPIDPLTVIGRALTSKPEGSEGLVTAGLR